MDNIRFQNIRLLVIDVDGTMTDGGIYYDNHGNELKKFCTKDAAGFFAAHQVGIKIMVLTGRECFAVTRRMQELRVDYLVQNEKNKLLYLQNFLQDNAISENEMGYIGDDLNDLTALKLAGFAACPSDACEEVKKVCDYVSGVEGGKGAVRDAISFLLKSRGEWEKATTKVYNIGI